MADDLICLKVRKGGASVQSVIFSSVDRCLVSVSFLQAYADPEGGTGGSVPPPPLENYKNIGFLCNTGPDLLLKHKATNPAFNVGPSSARQRNAI